MLTELSKPAVTNLGANGHFIKKVFFKNPLKSLNLFLKTSTFD
jgi:hypothetical protein